jgi:hypothetical protein
MSTIKTNAIQTVAGKPILNSTGSILQIVQGTLTSTFSSTVGQSAPVDIGLSASITPSSTSSKILITVSIGGISGNVDTTHGFFLLRGSTSIGIADAAGSRSRTIAQSGHAYSSAAWRGNPIVFSYLDSPSTTSATTYKVQGGGNGSATWYINRTGRDLDGGNEDSRAASSIILMEVSG